ncbi:MAG: hypothetical protein PHD37_17655 [Gallionellaceae bacterium]|nr:hypothetical protein [Gallionellaceae bacterium]
MSRKPAHLELAGGKSQRQRIWEAIRAKSKRPFELAEVTPGNVQMATAREYLTGLVKAGFLGEENSSLSPKIGAKKIYFLVRDTGAEAPRVRKDGSEVTQGCGNEAIWGAMQAMGSFTSTVLANMAGAKESTVKTYCTMLHQAGYLAEERQGKGTGRGGIASQYRLLKSRISGPRPPMITRLKAVYDPNLHQIVWQQGADEALEAAEGRPC